MITNYPAEKSSIFYPHVYWEGYFTNEELDLIIQYCENKKLEEGKIQSEINNNVRKSKVNFTEPDEENRWIFNKLNNLLNVELALPGDKKGCSSELHPFYLSLS